MCGCLDTWTDRHITHVKQGFLALLLYSYASLDSITVFFLTISIDVYCPVNVELKSPAMKILYSSCLLR